MAAPVWEEVSQALAENRRELVLTGKEIANKIQKHGVDNRLYTLNLLNFLEISAVELSEVSNDIGNLEHLVNLVLRSNKLTSLPDSICQLKALRFLDLSRNQLKQLPNEIGDLVELHTVDLSGNELEAIPESVNKLNHLTLCNISSNNLSTIDSLLSADLVHLSEIIASGNQIDHLSSDVSNLHILKKIDLASNKIQELPASLAECHKLRDLDFKSNPIKDRRLAKLIQQGKGHKAILDYVHSHGVKPESSEKGQPQKKDKKKGGRKKKASESAGDTGDDLAAMIRVLSVRADDCADNVEVLASKAVASVRPYIVCCIVKDVDLAQGNMFKRFITAQTKLHDGPLCAKRTKATIATHDLCLIQSPLKYDARPPQQIEILPLGRKQHVTAEYLVARLHKEAEDLRKQMKRSTVSGIHKYLDLLSGHETYPCLLDKEGQVISFPPITNSDISKISKSTTNIFIEVTSSTDLGTCKKVMDTLMEKMVELSMSKTPTNQDGEDEEAATNQDEAGVSVSRPLIVQQVRVLDEDGGLKVVYPSRTDLDIQGIKVAR
ncbi:leucine-rich repeat-containing protein 47-like [Amphiura filiformis]|uniref:leucine-rich repeat-containing protein 47-like n=1 Tax=Amphiura filiformis TaxID=82378 RepID=UPI003B2214F4